jgi:hypothetical protein
VPSFVVDPLLSTVPDPSATSDEARRLLEELDAWLAAVEGSPFPWRHVLACTRALEENGRFPTFTSLRDARQAAGSDINIAALLRHLTRFFQDEARDLLAETATRCAVVAEPVPRIAPPELVGRNLPEIGGFLRDALLCLACDKAAGERFATEAHLVTRPFAEAAHAIVVEGTVDLIEPEGMSRQMGGQALAQKLPAVFSPAELTEFHYEAVLAGGAEHLPALVSSIAATTYPGAPLLALIAGSQLWRSLQRCGMMENRFAVEKLLKICAALIAGRSNELNVERRPLRETQAADSPQRTRPADNAKAWRVTVTDTGAGYRLHYWHRPVGQHGVEQIELANALRERDPKVIPES